MSLPTPYYQSERVTLYCGDCLDVLPHLAGIDAVVTDPPYGVSFRYASHNDTPDGYAEWCREWFASARSVCSGPVLVSCGLLNVGLWEKPTWVLCWHKPAAMGRCAVGFNNWEPVLVYGSLVRQCADVFTATITPDPDVAGHPCPKPLAWARRLVDMASNDGDTVCDPFTGSGTTGVAAVRLGRKFIGIEIDEGYCAIAKRRIIEAEQAFALFDPPKPEVQTEIFAEVSK